MTPRRYYSIEWNTHQDGSTYYFVIDSSRELRLNKHGQWVSSLSVDSYGAEYATPEEVLAAVMLYETEVRRRRKRDREHAKAMAKMQNNA